MRSYTRHAAASLLPCHGLTLPSCRLLSCLFMPADMAANSFGPNIIIGRLALIAIQLPIHKPRENNWLAPCAQARAHQQALWLVRALFFCFLQLNCTSITAKKRIQAHVHICSFCPPSLAMSSIPLTPPTQPRPASHPLFHSLSCSLQSLCSSLSATPSHLSQITPSAIACTHTQSSQDGDLSRCSRSVHLRGFRRRLPSARLISTRN